MATVNVGSVDEEFLTCGVCMNEYDELLKIPKCLPCSHTICLTCLEGILNQDRYPMFILKCPFCRNVSQHNGLTEDLNRADLIRRLLPNNIYTLQIIKLNKKIASSTKLEQSWCFSCGSETIDSCSSFNHHTVDLTVGTIRNLENFAKVKKEAGIKKEIDKLTTAIAKGKHIRKNLELFTVSMEAAQEEIKQLQQENILHLTHMSSKLAALKATQSTEEVVSRDKPEHFFSSEVWSLLKNNDSTMVDAGKEKFNEQVDAYYINKENLKVTSELFHLLSGVASNDHEDSD